MFYTLTPIQKKEIEDIYQHFLPKFPDISKETLHDRIFCGYCWGEGRLPIISIDDWNNVFYNGKLKGLLTCFDNWNDYMKYDGDFHKKEPFPRLRDNDSN